MCHTFYITCRDDNATPLPSLSMFTSQLPSTLALLFPGPPKARPGTHCLRLQGNIPFIFSVKGFVHFFVRMRRLYNQEYRAFFDIDSSDDLTAGILLFRRGSIIFQTYGSTEKVTNRFTKKARW